MTNMMYGRYLWGKHRWAQAIKAQAGGGDAVFTGYQPNVFHVIAYNADGTIAAVFGAGSEADYIKSIQFELTETGCGAFTIVFTKLPEVTELTYMQRIDIHLYGDARPWYSGYVQSIPIKGTTETEFTVKGFGYYDALDNVIVFGEYLNRDAADIVKEFARLAETRIGTEFNTNQIVSTQYRIERLVFDGVKLKDALKTLSDFAVDYVYGVNERRQLFFKPRDPDINEQARFWVGQHLDSYAPAWDASKIVNWARIKGGNIDDEGEQWLTTVEDAASQKEYGFRADVWTLPEAYDVADAKRWGESQMAQKKVPQKTAKLKGVRLEYPNADGSFNVRKLSTEGQAIVNTLDGTAETYPITKLKYNISSSDGIKCEMELGKKLSTVDRYFAELDRSAKATEALSGAAIKQLKGG